MLDPSDGLLRGSYVPLVTPFSDGELDVDAYIRLVDLHRRAGSDGLVVCGTSGEPGTLTLGERMRIAEAAVEGADGQLPVVVATGTLALAETIELSRHAEKIGASAAMVVTPYYLLPPERGVVEYYRRVADASALPLVIYHIPRRTGLTLTVATIEAVAAVCPTLAGIKHSSADLGLVSDLVATFGKEFRILGGLEDLSLPMLVLGASGVVSAVGNVAPRLVAQLCRAVDGGDLALAKRVHYRLLDLNKAVFWDTNPIAVKYMLTRIGVLERNEHRPPMAPATPDLMARLDAVLAGARITDAFVSEPAAP